MNQIDSPNLNREQPIQEAFTRLDSMLADNWVRDCVLFFHGPPLIGKTTLLKEIQRRMSARGLPSARMDFFGAALTPARVAKQIRDQWAHSADFVSGNGIDETMNGPEAADHLFEFARHLYQVSVRRPLILFLDSMEDCPAECLDWLQMKFLPRLIEEFSALVIMAGRQHPGQNSGDLWIHDLERRTARFILEPFTSEETARQIECLGAATIPVETLMTYTHGLPGLNTLAADKFPKDRPLEKEEEKELRQRLADAILERTPEELRVDLSIVSCLWQFDRELLEVVYKAIERERDLDALLKELSATSLIQTSPGGYARTMLPTIRPVLEAALQQASEDPSSPCAGWYTLILNAATQWLAEKIDYSNIASRIFYQVRLGADESNVSADLKAAFEGLEKRNTRQSELAYRIERGLQDIKTVLPAHMAATLLQVSHEYLAKFK